MGSCQHDIAIKKITLKKDDILSSILEKKTCIDHQKARKQLNIRHLNGHLNFSSGFQVTDPSNYEKMQKSRKNTGH